MLEENTSNHPSIHPQTHMKFHLLQSLKCIGIGCRAHHENKLIEDEQ